MSASWLSGALVAVAAVTYLFWMRPTRLQCQVTATSPSAGERLLLPVRSELVRRDAERAETAVASLCHRGFPSAALSQARALQEPRG